MNKKIRVLEQAEIIIDGGYGVIHIAEGWDGTFNIDISETTDHKLRVGIPFKSGDKGGKTYMYWDDIKKKLGE